jgi:hypothetical protein
MKARAFDKILVDLIQRAYEGKGLSSSLNEIRKIYGIHSFRVGGDNAHKAANTPLRYRKLIGHWKSDVIDAYSRAQLEAMCAAVEGQDVDCALLQVRNPDMPTYPEAQHIQSPGLYTVERNSRLQDLSEDPEDLRSRVTSTLPGIPFPNLMGLKIAKTFEGRGIFHGTVIEQDPSNSWYRIKYSDDDEEDLTLKEIKDLQLVE